MVELVACLSTGKGTWGHVARLMADGTWDNIILITNEFGKENFTSEKSALMLVMDTRKPIAELVEDMKNGLDGKIKGKEVALNIVSGDGKEHMALLSALQKLDIKFRPTALTKDGIKEI
jgi:hypothetical protein